MKTPPLLVEDVKKYVRRAIASGKYKPGEKITEISLQKKWGISRSPVREALRSLEMEGLVVLIPRKGAYVSDITVDDLKDTTVILATLEALAINLAMPNFTPKDIEVLDKLMDKMAREAKDLLISEYTHTHNEYHRAFTAPCHNKILIDMIADIRMRYVRPKVTAFVFVHNRDVTVTAHRNILKTIKKRDCEKAEEFVRSHVIESFSRALDNLEESSNKTINISYQI